MKNWKKAALLAALLGLLLTACAGEKSVSGEITRIWSGDGAVTAFTIRTEEGNELGFRVFEQTRMFDKPEDYQVGNVVVVDYKGRDGTLELSGGSGEGVKAYKARYVTVSEWLEREAVTLEDGTKLDALRNGYSECYKLPGGERLLKVTCRETPERSFAAGGESLEDLNAAAREKVAAYYEARGCLYDLDRELEQAWAEYREREDFQCRWVDQDVSPSTSGREVMYFLTTVRLPVEGTNEYQELRLGDAFDRETGERIPVWDLFTCSEEEAVKTFLDLAGVEEKGRRSQMEAALDPDNILFFQKSLAFYFGRGSLPGEEHAVELSVEYSKLGGLLQEWAVPGAGG